MKTYEWLRVRRDQPCAICGKADWCTFTADGTIACCMRVQSAKSMANGGWCHPLTAERQEVRKFRPMRKLRPEPPRLSPEQVRAMHCRWLQKTASDDLDKLSEELGVSADSLRRLGAAWANEHGAWAFPMFDAQRQMIGIRLRAASGRKWAVHGSRTGLFYPYGVPGEMQSSIVICEGPTDAAAILDLGFDAIGRPSCSGGADLIAELLSEDSKEVVILADADGPGKLGAKRLAESLFRVARSVKIIRPLRGKDAREWVANGATRSIVETVIQSAKMVRRAG